jgi:ketosteroid isomerase-like protein
MGIQLLAPVLLAGCIVTPAALAAAQTPAGLPSSPEQAVLAFEAELMNSYNGGDAAVPARHYATDAFVYVPGEPVARGRAAITANIARFMRDSNFRLGYENEIVTVAASNDLAHTRGKLRITFTDPKSRAARMATSHYLLVMRRDPQSGWQVVEDVSF